MLTEPKSKQHFAKLPKFAAMSLDKQYMRRCFELALLGIGKEGSNPLVGAVIVHEGKVIGEGWHQKYGSAHAEVNAVNSVKDADIQKLKDSEIYVSLEPCFHQGKTPPCVNLIIKHNFKRVVVSCLDVNPKVSGQSIRKLKEHGIDVTVGVLEHEGKQLVRRFTTFQILKRPYVILKWAESEDGFLGKENEQVWLTGATAKKLVHKWRSEEAAIMIGTNTAKVDNPRLTNRLYSGKSPLRVVLDRKGKLSKSLHVMDGSVPTLCISEKSLDLKKVETVQMNFDDKLLMGILEVLYDKGIKSLIVEGGAKLLASFIEKDLWDEARIFTAPIRLDAGIKAPKISRNEPEEFKIAEDQLYIIMNSNKKTIPFKELL